MNETRQLAQFAVGTRFEDLNREVVEKAKELVLDQMGCQLAFAVLPWSREIYHYVRDKNTAGQCTIVHYGLKTGPEEAAFANATFGHGFEMDDTEMITTSHPGVVVIPPALAMGEMEVISGREFITAIVIGYDVMLRTGMAGARALYNRGFHSTPVLGPLGGAAAVGKILKFDVDKMVNALAIAVDQSCGTTEFSISGGSVKRLHAGFGAQAGLKAALLARYGITGPATTVEGRRGFCFAFAGEYDLAQITHGLGKEFKIMLTGNKPYCCCAAQHSVIDATAKILARRPIQAEEVDEIIVEQRPREYAAVGHIIEPQEVTGAQFSARFGVALRIIQGGNGYRDYQDKNVRDHRILALAKKVKCVADENYEKLKIEDGGPAIVTIKLKDGNSCQERVDYATGTRQNPMRWPELETKFRGLTAGTLPAEKAEAIVQTVKKLEDLADIRTLADLLIVGQE